VGESRNIGHDPILAVRDEIRLWRAGQSPGQGTLTLSRVDLIHQAGWWMPPVSDDYAKPIENVQTKPANVAPRSRPLRPLASPRKASGPILDYGWRTTVFEWMYNQPRACTDIIHTHYAMPAMWGCGCRRPRAIPLNPHGHSLGVISAAADGDGHPIEQILKVDVIHHAERFSCRGKCSR